MKIRILSIVFLVLVLVKSVSAQSYPKPPDNLPGRMYFSAAGLRGEKDTALSEDAYELYINDEANDLKAFIDSVLTGYKIDQLSLLELKWNISPEATDEQKNEVIDKLVAEINRLVILKERSQLKQISIAVGDGMFIFSTDKLKYYESKGQKENLIRTYKKLQPEFAKLPFKLEVFADNWGW